jgi:hypothetical protein
MLGSLAAAVIIVAAMFGFPIHTHHDLNLPGDDNESPSDRAAAARQWVSYDAARDGTKPLDVLGKLVVALNGGTKMNVRPSLSKGKPGGVVVQLDGDATIEVKSAADHMTLVGTEASPSLVLRPGKYAVHEEPRDFAVDVTNIGNDSAVVTTHGAPVIVK